ncbi:unnamed protein product [Adineta ricciae]|uniref:Uncharacterized protein n=1 Tax=Adineta ricciae TaxID=249248 RepID=A0A815IVR8_ADIRI|nr:unnamed protein product [Adineta ricciae]CAF1369954.1 unnamed protein product [Adineta ricciae]
MKVLTRVPLTKHPNVEEKQDYADYSQTRLITLLQIPHYEHLQILICNGNSLTTLAGIENLKHLWKLDVGNNQIRSLQHLTRFIAFGSLILSNNHLTWFEFQHIRHMFILDLRTDGNPILDSDPNYRQHVLDCLPRVWMCDGVFVSTNERNQVDEFFTQSSLTQKPVRHKLARDMFMPTNLKDRSVNGLFGSKTTELLAKFPSNAFINAELDRKRIKHLASTIQDLFLIEMKYDVTKKYNEFLTENRHNFYHLTDLRQAHIEEFNMLLIILLTDLLFKIPGDLLDNIMEVTRIKTIETLNVSQIFSASSQLKCLIASLVHAGARLDRDENHPSAFYDKLFSSLSIVVTNQMRQLSPSITNQTYQNSGLVSEAKAMVCLEVMQVFIMCPVFYTLVDHPNVNAILQQALGRSPAYGSIRDVLQSFVADQKTAEEQKDLLSPILGNILKMTIRTLSTKRMKKSKAPSLVANEPLRVESTNSNQHSQEHSAPSSRSSQRPNTHRVPNIGDRVLTAPQRIGRIVTIPDTEIAMVQFDHILSAYGAMVSNGSLSDHTNYIHLSDFEWDIVHEYWKPKCASGDKITLQMTTIRNETTRLPTPPQPLLQPSPRTSPPPPRNMTRSKTPESVERECLTPKIFDMDLHEPIEPALDVSREVTPQPSPVPAIENPTDNHEETVFSPHEVSKSPSPIPPTPEPRVVTPDEPSNERPLYVRITKQKQEQQPKLFSNREIIIPSPVLIESTVVFIPERIQTPSVTTEYIQQPTTSSKAHINESRSSRISSTFERSPILRSATTACPRSTTHRVHVPVHNASQWFSGPDMKNERTGRMERVVAALVHRSYRPPATYGMRRVPTLTSPSSKDHVHSKGIRPGTSYDFHIDTHRMTPAPLIAPRPSQSSKNYRTASMHSNGVNHSTPTNSNINRVRSLLNPPCPSPAWM